MILERVEKDNLIKAIYESSNILSSSYDKTDKSLTIIFNDGGSYTYKKVKETDYLRFEISDSQGKFFNETIKHHEFVKNDNVNTLDVVNKIKEIKRQELLAMEVGIINLMKENIKYYDETKLSSKELIYKVNNMINKYIEMSK